LIGVKSQLQLAINGLLTVTQDGGSIASWCEEEGATVARGCRQGVPIRGQTDAQNFPKNNLAQIYLLGHLVWKCSGKGDVWINHF
jgi:hypothetical protein